MISPIAVPLPPTGFRIDIVSLPEAWLKLSDKTAWNRATQELLKRIGTVCQTHIRNIMAGREPRRDGTVIQFQDSTGRGIQSIQWDVHGSSVDIYADDRTKTKNGTSYLVYQEYGVSAQPMTWLVGKTIPWTLVRGSRLNPKTGTVVQGVTRVKYAGPGSRFAGKAGGVIAQTPMVGKETLDGVHYSTITQATFSEHSDYNPTGFRWWNPGFPGKSFFREGILAGMGEAAGAMEGLAVRVAGSSFEAEQTDFTPEYQGMLDDLEKLMMETGVFPFPD